MSEEQDKFTTGLPDIELPLGPDHPPLPLASDDLAGSDKLMLDEPCGAEDRIARDDTTIAPWSAICYLIMKKRWGTFRGTGFFISADTIVTAGHCIRTPNAGGAKTIQVIPGRNGRIWPYESALATEFRVPDEWSRNGDARFDYGVIKLTDGGLGARAGQFALANLADAELESAHLITAGYPSDIEPSTRQHSNAGPCSSVENQRLGYMLDTWRGASGSPVWVDLNGVPTVVGIHNYGHCPNRATRINVRVLADLNRWMGSS